MASKILAVYLNDHLAGATGGVDLARRIEEEARGTAAEPFVAGLADDIDSDRSTLQDLMNYLRVEQQPVKQAVGWAAEKLSRLKTNRSVAGTPELALLMSLEALSSGVEGKRGLWQSLLAVADLDPSFAGLDLDICLKRAIDQTERIEAARLAIAAPALAGVEP